MNSDGERELSLRALDPDGELAWQRLRNAIELSADGWFGFVFAVSDADAEVLRERARRTLRMENKLLLTEMPRSPAELRGLLRRLRHPDFDALWIEALTRDSEPRGEWMRAWEHLLLRLNERRDSVRKSLRSGLVLCMPPSLKPLVRDAAPDLWSMRGIVIEMAGRRMEREPERFMLSQGPTDTALEGMSAPADEDIPDYLVQDLRQIAVAVARGHTGTAVALARDFCGRAEQDPRTRRLALKWLSYAEAADGDMAAAGEHAEQALAIGEVGVDDVDLMKLSAETAERLGDLALALARRTALVELARRQLETNPTALGLQRTLVSHLIRLGEARRRVADLRGARDALADALLMARRMAAESPNTAEMFTMIEAMNRLGEVLGDLGQLGEARAILTESVAVARQLCAQLGESTPAQRLLGLGLLHLGDILRGVGDLRAARSAYEEAVFLRKSLLDRESTDAALRDVQLGLRGLGDACRELGALAEAAVAFEEALEIARRRYDNHPESALAMRDLTIALDDSGALRAETGDIEGATSAFEESLELVRRLAAGAPRDPTLLHDLSVSLDNVGDVRREVGDLAAAETAYVESLALRQRLLDEFGDNPTTLRSLMISWGKVGDVHALSLRDEQAANAYRETLRLARSVLAQVGSTPATLRDLGVALGKLSSVTYEQDPSAAKLMMDEALMVARLRATQYDQTPTALRDVALALQMRGAVRERLGDEDGMVADYEEAVRVYKRLTSGYGASPVVVEDLGELLALVVDALRARGRTARAEAYNSELRALRSGEH